MYKTGENWSQLSEQVQGEGPVLQNITWSISLTEGSVHTGVCLVMKKARGPALSFGGEEGVTWMNVSI